MEGGGEERERSAAASSPSRDGHSMQQSLPRYRALHWHVASPESQKSMLPGPPTGTETRRGIRRIARGDEDHEVEEEEVAFEEEEAELEQEQEQADEDQEEEEEEEEEEEGEEGEGVGVDSKG